MVQESEVVTLILAMAFVLCAVFFSKSTAVPRAPLIYTGIFFIICAYAFTVVEGLFWRELFNFLEHLCYALAGIAFAVGCWSLCLETWQKEERTP